MKARFFSLLILLGTIISWVAFLTVIFKFDPFASGPLNFMSFYLSLFLAISGSIFIILDWLKSKIFRRQLLWLRVRASIRHAVLFSVLIVAWAVLKSQHLLVWWTLLMLVLVLAALELFFLSAQKKIIYERQTSEN